VQVVNEPDSFRVDDIRILDGRPGEGSSRFSDFGFTVSGGLLQNIFNEGFVQQRNHRPEGRLPAPPNPARLSLSNWATEVTSPRIFRLGARFQLPAKTVSEREAGKRTGGLPRRFFFFFFASANG